MIWHILGAILLALVLLLCLPLSVKAVYDEKGFAAKAYFGPFSYGLYPRPDRKTVKKQKAAPVGKAKKKPDEAPKGGSAKNFTLLLQQLPAFLNDLRRKLRVKNIQLKYTLAGGDPADLALNYGKAWAAVGNLWPYLERIFVIKKRDVSVSCDFEGSQETIFVKLHISITLGRALGLVCKHGVRLLSHAAKTNEGGVKHE